MTDSLFGTASLLIFAWWALLFGVLWFAVRRDWLAPHDAIAIGLVLGSLGALWQLWPRRIEPTRDDQPAPPDDNPNTTRPEPSYEDDSPTDVRPTGDDADSVWLDAYRRSADD